MLALQGPVLLPTISLQRSGNSALVFKNTTGCCDDFIACIFCYMHIPMEDLVHWCRSTWKGSQLGCQTGQNTIKMDPPKLGMLRSQTPFVSAPDGLGMDQVGDQTPKKQTDLMNAPYEEKH